MGHGRAGACRGEAAGGCSRVGNVIPRTPAISGPVDTPWRVGASVGRWPMVVEPFLTDARLVARAPSFQLRINVASALFSTALLLENAVGWVLRMLARSGRPDRGRPLGSFIDDGCTRCSWQLHVPPSLLGCSLCPQCFILAQRGRVVRRR